MGNLSKGEKIAQEILANIPPEEIEFLKKIAPGMQLGYLYQLALEGKYNPYYPAELEEEEAEEIRAFEIFFKAIPRLGEGEAKRHLDFLNSEDSDISIFGEDFEDMLEGKQ